MAILHRVPDRVGACITEVDFLPVCKNKAVLDVILLSLHDLRADSLIHPIVSRSVSQLLSNNHCHFNNPIFSAYLFYPAQEQGPNYNASRLFSLFCI